MNVPYMIEGCVAGNIHQGCNIFRNAGVQCTAIAYMAIVTIFLYNSNVQNSLENPLNNFSSQIIDDIVVNGNQVYENLLIENGFPEGHYLAHDELPSILSLPVVGNINSVVYSDMLYGMIGQTTYEQGSGALNFQEAFNTGFQVSDFLLCTFGDLSIAVARVNTVYYIFDSHSRNTLGQFSESGSSVLLQFNSMSSVVNYLNSMYGGAYFNISPVILQYDGHACINNEISMNTTTTENTACMHVNGSDIVNEYLQKSEDFRMYRNEVDQATLINIEETNTLKRKFDRSDHMYSLSLTKKRKSSKRVKVSNKSDFHIVMDMNNDPKGNFITVLNGSVSEVLNVSSSELTHLDKNAKSDAKLVRNNVHSELFDLEIRRVPEYSCSSCGRFLFENEVNFANLEGEHFSMLGLTKESKLCAFCLSSLKKTKPYVNLKYNELEPFDIPYCLQGLTTMEKRLISKIHVFMTIIILPGGQYAEKGMAIDFPTNMIENFSSLPRKFSDSNIITVSYGENKDLKTSHLVRKAKISKCLQWLKLNNAAYKNITVDNDALSKLVDINEANDGVHIDNIEEFGIIETDQSLPNVEFGNIANMEKFPHLNLQKINGKPVNCYDLNEGEECAFPYLFPKGINGFSHKRNLPVPVSQYFKYRLLYKDGRFRKDLPYVMHAIDYYEFSRLMNSVSIHMRMKKNANPVKAKDIKDFKVNKDFVENSYMFMKQIKGTAAYWKTTLQNLLAMFKSLGPPSIFLTLSANDMHWPDLLMNLKGCSYHEASQIKNGIDLVRQDPFMTALHFQRRYKSLFKHVICGKLKPLGTVIDYFTRIEFQNRGSPHVHMFLWIENFEKIFSHQASLLDYINRTISTNGSLSQAKKFQTHCHTSYCLRTLGACRFGFPFKPCQETRLLNNIDISSESSRGKFYELQRSRSGAYINAFNPIILEHWQANMDIQIVGNAESAAYYVCAYICKSEPEDLKSILSSVIENMPEGASQRQKMLKIGCCVLKSRRLSAQEAAYRLNNDLHLIDTSRSFIYLCTKPKSERYRILKPKYERDKLANDSTDIFYNNILDYYRSRPFVLENECFYEFAQWYVKCDAPKCLHSKAI